MTISWGDKNPKCYDSLHFFSFDIESLSYFQTHKNSFEINISLGGIFLPSSTNVIQGAKYFIKY